MLATLTTDVRGHTTASLLLLGAAVLAFFAALIVHRDVALPRWRFAISLGLLLFAAGVAVG